MKEALLSKVEHVKVNKRLYGAFWTLPSGAEVYMAYRKRGEIFRSGKKTLSEAIGEDVACWAFDVDTIKEVEARGIKFVGVLVKESQEIYLTSIKSVIDKSSVLNYSKRGGALQRYVPLSEFKKTARKKL